VFFGSSVRRLTMYRDGFADLSDVKIVAACGGCVSVLIAALVAGSIFDVRTATCAGLLTASRAADSFAEVGQGVWCLAGRLKVAGRALTVRMVVSTTVSCALFRPLGLLGALAIGVLVRITIAAWEAHSARQQEFRWPNLIAVARTARFGSYVGAVAGIITLIDTIPTLAVTRASGLSGAGILTPLGRIRFGCILLATTLGEVYYGDMARAVRKGVSLARVTAKAMAQFIIAAAVAGVVVSAGGAELAFGPRLDGHGALIALCLLAGVAMGLNNLLSIGLTARAQIGVQLVAYSVAAAIAVGGTWLSDWSVRGLFYSEIAGCAVSFTVIAGALLSRTLWWRAVPDQATTAAG
jgi:hypothetical protein